MAKNKPPDSPANPVKGSLETFFSPEAARARRRSPVSDQAQRKKPRRGSRSGKTGNESPATGDADKLNRDVDHDEKVETMVLDESDDGGEDDDLIIVDPPALQTISNDKEKVKEEHDEAAAPRFDLPAATIFQKKTLASPSTAPPSPPKTGPSLKAPGSPEILQSDPELDIKRSPTKLLSFFDTASASSSSALASTSSSATPSQQLDTPLFIFLPSSISFFQHSRTPFGFLVTALVLLSSTKSRLLIQLVLTNLVRTVVEKDPASLESVVYLLSNKIGPTYETGTELGVGWQVLSKAIKETSGATAQKLKQLGNKLGDPGDIAFEASKSVRLLVKPAPLLCHSVYATLLQIAKLKGTGVLTQKTSLVKKLLLSSTGEEVRYIVRILVQNLRIGAVRLTLLTALARAFCLSRAGGGEGSGEYWVGEKERGAMREAEEMELERVRGAAEKSKGRGGGSGKGEATKAKPRKDRSEVELKVDDKLKKAEALVRRVWARHPNFGHLVKALLEGGLDGLEKRVGLSVGIPLEPMLGSITRSLSEIYTRLASRPFVSEAKLDGQRGQIHVFISDPSKGEPGRPPGVAEGTGMFAPEEGTGGRRVWVRLFSRHLEDMTQKYPDLIGTVAALVARQAEVDTPLRSFIIDCEVVAIDPNTGAFKTFQELSYRSKKDVELGDIKVRVGIYCFDLMFLNDESLLATPFRQRRDLLRRIFAPLRPPDPRLAKWELIPCCMDNDLEKVREFFDECLGMKAEGIMVKLLDEAEIEVDPTLPTDADPLEDLDGTPAAHAGAANGSESETVSGSESFLPKKGRGKATSNGIDNGNVNGNGTGGKSKSRKQVLPATYEPDKRAMSWLKVKKDYMEDLGDSLDLVPIGAWHGNGRKAQWWSPFLLACYDEETGAYTAVTKCLSGFTDSFYKQMREKYSDDPENPLTSKTCWPEVEAGGLTPDIWFKPSEVWEIRGADFTLSPVYPAARSLLGERGVSVRFPRYIRTRDDKSIENATTAEQLASLFEKQGQPGGGAKGVPKIGGEEEEEA
ncbi:hypothetical protein JCM21900_001639 [Sporobolomyces salmonicolor]